MKLTPEMFDPELWDVVEAFFDSPMDSEETFRLGMEAGQSMVDTWTPDGVHIEEVQIPASTSDKPIRTLILRPEGASGKLPGVFWVHGGAFATGAPEGSMSVFERLIKASPCVIVSPDYRLALKDPYPAGMNDCWDALLWMKEHADELGIRTDQIAAGGDSSGANYAVVMALRARDTGKVQIAFQMPIFPCLDDTLTSESVRENNAPLVDYSTIYYMWKVYLGEMFQTDRVPAYAAPIHATNFKGLPPLISYVGGVDPLRDDGVFYAEKLKAEGIPVHFEVFAGCFHGFEEFCPDAQISIRAKQFFVDSYKYAIEHYFAPQHERAKRR